MSTLTPASDWRLRPGTVVQVHGSAFDDGEFRGGTIARSQTVPGATMVLLAEEPHGPFPFASASLAVRLRVLS